MWKPVLLPFESNVIPNLPTVQEIRACSKVLRARRARSDAKVVALNDKLVAKFGIGVDASEGQALLYLERHAPTIPAPRLYAMYYDLDELFLVMERAPGVQLDAMWPSMSSSEKGSLVDQLRHIFESMRRVECPWPEDFYGGLDGESPRHYLFYSQKTGDERYLGPFKDETAFVQGLIDNYRALVDRNAHPDFKARYYEIHLHRVLRNHRATLTHGDVHRKNIMVAEKSRHQETGERSFSIVLVDWEAAGWYPDFWEYFCTSSTPDFLSWEEDWCWHAGKFLEVWPAETAMMRMLHKDLAF